MLELNTVTTLLCALTSPDYIRIPETRDRVNIAIFKLEELRDAMEDDMAFDYYANKLD